MTIINVRGLSGSGKTTTVKNILSLYTNKREVRIGHKHPIAYKLTDTNLPNVVVLGHYENEISVGGADTIPQSQQVQALAQHYVDCGWIVLYEAMLYSINNTIPTHIVFVDPPSRVVAAQRSARSIAQGGTGQFQTASGILTKGQICRSYNAFTGWKRHCIDSNAATQQIVALLQTLPTNQIIEDTYIEVDAKFRGAKVPKRTNEPTTLDVLFG